MCKETSRLICVLIQHTYYKVTATGTVTVTVYSINMSRNPDLVTFRRVCEKLETGPQQVGDFPQEMLRESYGEVAEVEVGPHRVTGVAFTSLTDAAAVADFRSFGSSRRFENTSPRLAARRSAINAKMNRDPA